eukprot:CAMPEP_0172529950 /NCGR_PEP_ID=MMETSP1067-20121228/3865_1 /TAXON_ID=265564 ORGANISM="Thalassiosira punctigera, Strain Tpunct2005C2" /NCGR_SAMPLE_ID=MMETSP1067 /ASSEMBLY_ACC=CAM_ASM_000444 /LENGTH=390 /DNA_ID=CAMNT_0013314087 /DNA_START=55 /DNA_END=1227 /DNA_ORIENTATION=+
MKMSAMAMATIRLRALLLSLFLVARSADAFAMRMASSITPTTSATAASTNRVAVVTGASRGIGRGIAVELGSAGYTVYVLGRSSRASRTAPDCQRPVAEGLELTVESTAEEITNRGGEGHAVPCDLSEDGVIEEIIENVAKEQGRLDVMVCSAYTTPSGTSLRGEFWKQGLDMWDAVNGVGLRQVYAACRAAAPHMIETAEKLPQNQPPLLCLVSSFGGKSYTFNVAYGVGKAAVDRLSTDMSYQLAKYGVATTTLYPGLVKTEANLQMVEDGTWDEASGNLDLTKGESPEFSGRALVKLASLDGEAMMARSGKVEVVAELAKEFDFYDLDGKRPPSIRSLQYLLPNFVFKQIENEAGKPVPDWIKDNVPDLLVPWSTFSSGPPPEMDTR